ncbi:hypothetical protein KI387_028560 [Taxus chinensis]|uniref:Triacylglycerol lipase n=1 Tax=Taxus chinensis TaxID=29808 RepID=A0AA38CDD8_TAXCH|nr:hypothetical protein KI387_028560 [Taxus chinensis]
MADNEENLIDFNATGPKNTHPHHPHFKRILLACLVNSAYIQEIHRQAALKPPQSSAASEWHSYFHYKLHSLLYSPADGSIFGAVFVYNRLSALRNLRFLRPATCPSAVIALRGTILSAASIISDLRDDLNLILQQIHKVSRVDEALRVTREMTKCYGAENVCLVGHSLGAAVALKVSRIIAAEEGNFIDTHLFNPPFFSLISVKHQKLGAFIHKIRAIAAGCITKTTAETRAAFLALQKWCPNLYVNVYDPVSCNYLHYFRARESNTAHNSIVNSVLRSWGRNPEPHHLVPSANLVVNGGGGKEFRFSHGLHQWWSEETVVKIEHYSLDVPEFVDRVNEFAEVADSGEEEIQATTLVTSKATTLVKETTTLTSKETNFLPSKETSPLTSKETTPLPSKATTFVSSKAMPKLIGV